MPLQDRLEKKSFFNWFYFAINWGSCLAVTVVVYVQDSISWAIGFAIPTVAMAIAIITFTAGSSLYTHVEPTERCVLPPSIDWALCEAAPTTHSNPVSLQLWLPML